VAFVLALEFGFRAPHKSAFPAALIGASLLPVAVSAPALARRAALAAAGLAAVSFALVALAPPRSERAPDPLDVRYILDSDRGSARVEVSTFGAPLPSEIGELRSFERASTPPFPWLSLDRSLYVAAAPLWDVPAPALEVLSDRRDDAGRVVRARIRSPRGAPRLHLRLPPAVSIASASWNGHVVRRAFAPAASHLFFGVETGGVEIELRTLTRGAFDVWLLDQDWTLPPDVSRLAESRPRDRCRRADGDVSIVGGRHRIAPLAEK
jgi:hypothetical protein